jgi:hypothetical protein
MCDSFDQPSDLHAYDHADGTVRSLGATAQVASHQTWNSDQTEVVYTAVGTLCATLYRRSDAGDDPVDIEVQIDGRRVPLGEDLAMSEDRCTHLGNADLPTFSPDGSRLAAFAASVEREPSMRRIDQPWSLVMLTNHEAKAVLGGLRYPLGLTWIAPDKVAFTAEMYGRRGLWTAAADGRQLTLVSDLPVAEISADAAGRVIALSDANSDASSSEVLLFDLSDIGQ